WSTNRNYFDEACRLVRENICQYIELYALPDTFDEYAQLWQTISIPYVIHAPHFMHGMNLADNNKRKTNVVLAEEAFKFADLLKANYVIFHPGVAGKDEETIYQLSNFPKNWKPKILIENKPYRTIDEPPLICNGHSPKSVAEIIKETSVGFCFDIGHCICSANSRCLESFIEITEYEKLNPTIYHLSDNDIYSPIDGHKHFGEGNYDFEKILRLIDLSKPISLETTKIYTDSLADFCNDINYIEHITNIIS
ncbi:MAG: sugar phosphate isomerase/epimerase, partial [Bacteroidales bacterium]|nr:sugar phosphate isomerase/epimerase [Bacteroidales bacterium]